LTQWGSQAGIINSVLQNKEALKLWAVDPQATLKSKIAIEAIYNPGFWTNLENLAIIIKPIYEA
jgi:ABC-type Zn uptake system ZnuABC Zn-binding protein ZnuA